MHTCTDNQHDIKTIFIKNEKAIDEQSITMQNNSNIKPYDNNISQACNINAMNTMDLKS